MFLKKDIIFRTNLMQSNVPIAENISPWSNMNRFPPPSYLKTQGYKSTARWWTKTRWAKQASESLG